MADIQLANRQNPCYRRYVVNRQTMPGINHQTQFRSKICCFFQAQQLVLSSGMRSCIGICAGMQLNGLCANITGSLDLLLIRIDKQRNADAGSI